MLKMEGISLKIFRKIVESLAAKLSRICIAISLLI